MKTLHLMTGVALALMNQTGRVAASGLDPTMTGADRTKHAGIGGYDGNIASIGVGLHIDSGGGHLRQHGFGDTANTRLVTSVDSGPDNGMIGGGGSIFTAHNVAGLTSMTALDADAPLTGHVAKTSIAGAAGHIAPA